MSEEKILDAKPGGASTEIVPSTIADVNAASSTAVDANKPQSFDEAADKIVAKGTEVETGSSPVDPKAKPEGGEIQTLNPTEKSEDKDSEEKVDGVKVEDEKLPFNTHPRFQELIKRDKESREFRETVKPVVERMESIDKYCQAHNIAPEQFKDFIEITALVNVDPAQALKRLEPLIQHLQRFQGEVLPEDLQTKVTAGTMEMADAKELAALRVQKRFIEQRGQQSVSQERGQATYNALTEWEQGVSKSDPDYARKSGHVNAKFSLLAANYPNGSLSPQLAVQLAKQAYDEVNGFVSSFIPKAKPTSPVVPSLSSRTGLKNEPKTWDEAVEQIQPRGSK